MLKVWKIINSDTDDRTRDVLMWMEVTFIYFSGERQMDAI